MPVALRQDAIDLGIVTGSPDAMVAFYRDLLGFVEEPQTPFPGGGVMYRLRCGKSLIKVVAPAAAPEARSPGGAIPAAGGLRYFTMQISNLTEMMQACEQAGRKVVIKATEIRPGVTIGIVEDPDGNMVEFVDAQ